MLFDVRLYMKANKNKYAYIYTCAIPFIPRHKNNFQVN